MADIERVVTKKYTFEVGVGPVLLARSDVLDYRDPEARK